MGLNIEMSCPSCGHRWQPRGVSPSVRCPGCGVKFTGYVDNRPGFLTTLFAYLFAAGLVGGGIWWAWTTLTRNLKDATPAKVADHGDHAPRGPEIRLDGVVVRDVDFAPPTMVVAGKKLGAADILFSVENATGKAIDQLEVEVEWSADAPKATSVLTLIVGREARLEFFAERTHPPFNPGQTRRYEFPVTRMDPTEARSKFRTMRIAKLRFAGGEVATPAPPRTAAETRALDEAEAKAERIRTDRRAREAEAAAAVERKIRHDEMDRLLDRLRSGEPDFRRKAAIALGQFGADGADAMPALQLVADKDPNAYVRLAAQAAIERIDAGEPFAYEFPPASAAPTTSRPAPPAPEYSSAAAAAQFTPSHGGTVQVKGYIRKDGTYVQPHTRGAPGTGKH